MCSRISKERLKKKIYVKVKVFYPSIRKSYIKLLTPKLCRRCLTYGLARFSYEDLEQPIDRFLVKYIIRGY